MDINGSDTLSLLVGNRTGAEELGEQQDLLALKILSITAVSLAVIILIASAIVCGVTYHKRNRQYRRAQEYEKMVKYNNSSPVHITGARRVLSIHKSLVLMRKRESSRHNTQVYFIYNNPALAVEEREVPEEIKEQPSDQQQSDNHRIPNDSKSTGIILNPCVFFI